VHPSARDSADGREAADGDDEVDCRMIEVRNLTKVYGNFVAVRDVSFNAERGSILGFLGPNGAGKTSTMRIITGFMPASSGTVLIDDLDIFENSLEARRRIGYLPENPPLYSDMRVDAYLRFVARLRGVERANLENALEHALHVCGLEDMAHRICGQLSKGYRQRVGLAQALIHDPPVLVLDEPTIGLDPRQIHEIRGLIKTMATGERTVVLSTHILPEVSQICDKVVIINEGRVALEQKISDLPAGTSLEDVFLSAITKEHHELEGSREETLEEVGAGRA
jgi:ABC-2 type transport system ATP-binding protein